MTEINFTFGIITYADNGINNFLPKVIESIRSLNIPKYEILIVGNKSKINENLVTSSVNYDTRVIDFDENKKAKWITRKKNLITHQATYQNIVYQHDYIIYDKDWYEGYKKFGDEFDICMNKIKNLDGTRYRDWVLFPYHHAYNHPQSKRLWAYTDIRNNEAMLPYNETRFTRWQYISGAYWVAKKSIMKQFPLNEGLVWGQGEDCEWSLRVKKRYKFSINPNSTVHLLKQHNPAFSPMRPRCFKKLEEYWEKINRGEIKE